MKQKTVLLKPNYNSIFLFIQQDLEWAKRKPGDHGFEQFEH